jgi:hypothetical protein
MLERIFRVLVGFVVACLAAGFAVVLFAVPPTEILNLPADVQADRLTKIGESGLFAAIWSLIFSFPFALVAAAIGEWRRIRSWTYYALVGLAISIVGLLTQHSAEQIGQPSIMNNYGLTAFITSGFVAGLAYWLLSGRLAGGSAANTVPAMPVAPKAEAQQPVTKPKATTASVPSSGTPKKA